MFNPWCECGIKLSRPPGILERMLRGGGGMVQSYNAKRSPQEARSVT